MGGWIGGWGKLVVPQGGKGSGAPRLSIEDAMPKEERFYCWGQCRTMRKSSAAQPQETRPHQTSALGCHQRHYMVIQFVQPQLLLLFGLQVPTRDTA